MLQVEWLHCTIRRGTCTDFFNMEPSVVPFLKQCCALFLSDQLLEMEMNVVISKAIKNPLKKVFLVMLGCTLSRLFIYVFESVRTSEYRQESNVYQTKLAW